MWIFTPFGFFSVVAHRDDANMLLVRARVRSDLQSFVARVPKHRRPRIVTLQVADYRYRIELPREQVAKLAAEFITKDLTYDNFKTKVAQTQGQYRARVYHRVWDDCYELQADASRAVGAF